MQEAITPGVVLKGMEGFRVSYVRNQGVYGDIGLAFQRLLHLLRERRLRPDGPMIALYYDEPTGEPAEEPRSEACVPVIGEVRADSELRVRDLPPGPAAKLNHGGPPSPHGENLPVLDAWIKANGYERAGPIREVYAKDLSDIPPGILYAEIQIPVRRKGRRA